jgi:hypothetical protein
VPLYIDYPQERRRANRRSGRGCPQEGPRSPGRARGEVPEVLVQRGEGLKYSACAKRRAQKRLRQFTVRPTDSPRTKSSRSRKAHNM